MQQSSMSAMTIELIEAIPDPVLVSRPDGEILAANARAGCLINCQAGDLPGRRIDDLIAETAVREAGEGGSSTATGVLSRLTGDRVPVRTVSRFIDDGQLLVTVIRLLTGAERTGSDRDVHVLETLSEGVMIVTHDGSVAYMNQAAHSMLGCDEGELPDSHIRSIFAQPRAANSEDDLSEVSLTDALIGSAPAAGVPAILRCSSTASLEVSVNATPLNSESAGPSGAIVTFQNTTRQTHAELQISIQKRVLDMIATGSTLHETAAMIVEYLERVIPGTRVAIYQIERDSRRIDVVAAPDIPETISAALSADADDPISAMCVTTLVSRQPIIFGDLGTEDVAPDLQDLLARSGTQSVWCYPVDGTAHRSVGVLALYRDVRGQPDATAQSLIETAAGLLRVALDRVQIELELRYQSFNDDLTGLPNRVILMDRLDIALQRAAQSDDQVALLLLNVDRFQMINNSLGHHAGDELLRGAARRLRDCVRAGDLVARFTGDTFGILLEHVTSETDAINVVMRIQRAFAPPLNVNDVEVYASISIGIAVGTDPQMDADTLVRYSDIALNRAKEVGRGQFAIFSPSQDLSRVPKIELQSRLHRALAADALDLHFQPVMSLRAERVAGYESLVRWTDKQFGVVSPDEFLPLAQQSGIMAEITSWVLDRAVSQLCQWQDAHGIPLFAAVNISPSEMNDSMLVEQVDAVLRRYQVSPQSLVLEMTEQALMDTAGRPRDILERLRNLGVRIALDDFGTGYSSLSYLEQFAVDTIKIDRAFIQAARGGASRAPVATAMVDLARRLGMTSVAEGIETIEDERVARQLGCDFSQGYLYGRPQPGSTMLPLITWPRPPAD